MLVTDVEGLLAALDKVEARDEKFAAERRLHDWEAWAKFASALVTTQTKVIAKAMGARLRG